MEKTIILPAELLKAGEFHFHSVFERDDEEPYGFFVVFDFVMHRVGGEWRYECIKDKYLTDEKEKNKIEKQVSDLKEFVGNPYYICRVLRDPQDKFKIKMNYNILYPRENSEANSQLITPRDCRVKEQKRGDPKYKLIRPSDCWPVMDNSRNAIIKHIPQDKNLPLFIKKRVAGSCLYVESEYNFNTLNGANDFYNEMRCIYLMLQVWRNFDNIRYGRSGGGR